MSSSIKEITSKEVIVKPDIYNLLFHPSEVVELRVLRLFGYHNILGNKIYCKNVVSGYFNDGKKLLQYAHALDNTNPPPSGVYFTLNPLHPDVIARANNKIRSADSTTDKNDVKVVRWLPIDLDPIRTRGVSSSNEELKNALELQEEIIEWLKEEFEIEPGVLAMSGNGAHILVRIEDLDPDIASPVIKQALQAIAQKFPSEATKVDVDCSVFDPSRIWKFYGTTARKGDHTSERPHRKAVIFNTGIQNLSDIPVNEFEKIRMLADSYVEPESKKSFYVNNNQSNIDVDPNSGANVDLDRFLKDYGEKIGFHKVKKWEVVEGSYIYILRRCLFAEDHKTPDNGVDSGFIRFPNGKVIYQCFHDHCRGKRTIYDALKRAVGDGWEKYVIKKKRINKPSSTKPKLIFDKESKAIFKEIITRDGEVITEQIENYVLWPKSILRDVFNNEPKGYKVELLTQNSNLEREIILDKITVNKLENLSLPPDNLRAVTSELIRLFQTKEDIQIEKVASKIGWLNNENFLHPIFESDIQWVLDDSANDKWCFNPNLDEDTARKNIKEIFRVMLDSELPIFVIVPFALQAIHNPENRVFFEIVGNTSTGKSVSARCIMQLLGWEDTSWENTYGYIIKYLSNFDNYPVLIDEMHKQKKFEIIVDVVYALTQGEDKGRLNRDGTGKKKRTFNTAVISTGEKSIIDIIQKIDDVKPFGAIARTLSLTVNKDLYPFDDMMKLINLGKETAGWLLKIWLKEHKKDSFDNVFKSPAEYLEITDYKYHAFTVFPIMFVILKRLKEMDLLDDEYYFKANLHLNNFKEQMEKFYRNEIEIDNEERMRERVEEYLIQNLNKFENIEGEENFRNERWGWKDENSVFIMRSTLRKIFDDLGIPQRLLKDDYMPYWIKKQAKKIQAIRSTRRVYVIEVLKQNKKEKEEEIDYEAIDLL